MTQHGMHLKTEFKKNVPYLFDQNGVISIVATQSLFPHISNLPKYTQTGTKCPSQCRGACLCSCRHMMLAMETS